MSHYDMDPPDDDDMPAPFAYDEPAEQAGRPAKPKRVKAPRHSSSSAYQPKVSPVKLALYAGLGIIALLLVIKTFAGGDSSSTCKTVPAALQTGIQQHSKVTFKKWHLVNEPKPPTTKNGRQFNPMVWVAASSNGNKQAIWAVSADLAQGGSKGAILAVNKTAIKISDLGRGIKPSAVGLSPDMEGYKNIQSCD